MVDIGQKETDIILLEFEQEVESILLDATVRGEDRLRAYLATFKKQDLYMRELVKNGKITKEEYIEWRKRMILRGKRFSEMLDDIADYFTIADVLIGSILLESLLSVYEKNYTFALFQVEKTSSINTGLKVEKPPKSFLSRFRIDKARDWQFNRRKAKQDIMRAILKGEPLDEVVKKLQNVAGMDYTSAVRNARTAMTATKNVARIDAYKKMQAMGVDIMLEWRAVHDDLTRASHAAIDGERINIGGVFSNGLHYPGDPDGSPEEVFNCRCAVVPHVVGPLKKGMKLEKLISGMSYSKWKAYRSIMEKYLGGRS